MVITVRVEEIPTHGRLPGARGDSGRELVAQHLLRVVALVQHHVLAADDAARIVRILHVCLQAESPDQSLQLVVGD